MTVARRSAAVIVLALASAIWTSGCRGIGIEDSPHIRGTLVAVDGGTIVIRHKTGKAHTVEVTADTRIVNPRVPGDRTLCAGQRATVFVSGQRRFTASSITLWSGRCGS
jgi:hypothetical protein